MATATAAATTGAPIAMDSASQQQALLSAYTRVTEEFLEHVKHECTLPDASIARLRHMFEYNILGGKYYRAGLVTNTVLVLCKAKGLDASRYFEQSIVLGWAIEVLQAMFLVADDMMDKSITRRGKPCWYLQPDVQGDAINDTLILESLMYGMLRKHFAAHPNYVDILHLYQSVSLYTQMGQMLDLTAQPQGRKDPAMLANFTLETYERIVTYKTALYTFYLSLAAGMLLVGINGEEELKIAKNISVELGKKFQIEDDYLDCYGLPEEIGKVGTDIRDYKCSWLVVQALKRVNAEQRALIEAAYGHEEREQEIKDLYKQLDLEAVYEQQEQDSYARIVALIKQAESKLPAEMFMPILDKIHKRRK